MNTIIFTIFFFVIASYIGYIIYNSRRDIKKLIKTIGIVVSIILALGTLLNIYEANRMPIALKASKDYMMNINEVKRNNGTSIKLKKAFMDLNFITTTYGVKGPEKVVAVELKRNLDDTKPLSKITGLWNGKRFTYHHELLGFSYSADGFIDPLYVVFYLSNGENIWFKIEDRMNVKDKVKIVEINKTIKYDNRSITFDKFYNALNYSSLGFTSNFQPNNFEVIPLKDGKEMEKGSYGWSGGGSDYKGAFHFDPMDTDNLQIKIIDKSSNKEDIIDIK